MDAWSQEQLKKMQAGGNSALNSFLKEYGIEKTVAIKDKYSSKAAEVSCYQTSNQMQHYMLGTRSHRPCMGKLTAYALK